MKGAPSKLFGDLVVVNVTSFMFLIEADFKPSRPQIAPDGR